MSCWPWACRRDAPPGFRAAPRAVFAVTAIRLQSLTSSRLRRCALCLPPGDRHKVHPRRAVLGAPARPPNRLASDRPDKRPATVGSALGLRLDLLRQVVRMRTVLDAGGSVIASRRTVHGHAARPHSGASTSRLQHSAARVGRERSRLS